MFKGSAFLTMTMTGFKIKKIGYNYLTTLIAKLFLFDFVFVLSLKTHQGSMKCLNKIEYAATRQLVKAEVTPFPPLFLFCYNN